ncbi:MAG: putative molybdenum carrier protein [Thermodesulfobacteriota bacterium]
MFVKIISGGQTGADRAALDFAIEHDIPHGGWIPKGRLTEEGPLAVRYQLEEMPGKNYAKRTEKNILESDGTLIISHGKITGGTALTRRLAEKHSRPWLHIDLEKVSGKQAAVMIKKWVTTDNVRVMNVAGSRASGDPRIYDAVKSLLRLTNSK